MMTITRPRNGRRAFTLIELIVVITIIAVLAAMILPRLVGRVEDAKVAKAMADLSELSKELETFRLDVGRYPTTDEGLDALRNPPADAVGWKGPYAQKDIPTDPWDTPYNYQWPGQGGEDSYALSSYGNDHQPGGDGYAADLIESE